MTTFAPHKDRGGFAEVPCIVVAERKERRGIFFEMTSFEEELGKYSSA